MKKQELIRRIKAGAACYAQIKVKKGKDWQYVKLDSKNLLYDLEHDRDFSGVVCSSLGTFSTSSLWFDTIEDTKDE